MIINHHYRFIYMKNGRVASTSMEIALSKFCGPGDVITPISGKNESIRKELGFTQPQNFRDSDGNNYFWAHISAEEIKEKVPAEVWNNYFKFCIERNPWDRAVSIYYHHIGKANSDGQLSKELDEWLNSTDEQLSNWGNYTIGDKIAVDYVALYENLNREVKAVERKIGLPSKIPVKRVKAAAAKRCNRSDYRRIYTERGREIISAACTNEIEKFGYEF